MAYTLLYLITINFLSFVFMGIDKHRAIKQKYRIPERNLIMLAVLGGSFGIRFGMLAFRHKTLHKKFAVGVPCILLGQAALFFAYYYFS